MNLVSFSLTFSGEAEISSHYRESLEMSPALCYFMSKKTSKIKETNELLIKRLDPNAFESKRFAVESVLYTDGCKYAFHSVI